MNSIDNYNCDGLCCHITCGSRYTQFTKEKKGDMIIMLCFCDKHAEEYEKYIEIASLRQHIAGLENELKEIKSVLRHYKEGV